MDSVWCTYCDVNLRNFSWDTIAIEDPKWTLEKMQAQHDKVLEGRARLGGFENPLWDFADVDHFLTPVLHMEIGFINNVMTRLDDIIEERVENLTEEEVAARNQRVTAEITVGDCKKQLQQCEKEYGKIVAKIE